MVGQIVYMDTALLMLLKIYLDGYKKRKSKIKEELACPKPNIFTDNNAISYNNAKIVMCEAGH